MEISDSVRLFEQSARSYCRLLEGDVGPEPFELECLKLLLSLYGQALSLPDVFSDADEHDFTVERDAYRAVTGRLGERLSKDFYWCIQEPFAEPDQIVEPAGGSLTDDLADIWLDLKEGLIAWDSGSDAAVEHALWKWRFSFEIHWRAHAGSAIFALHHVCQDA